MVILAGGLPRDLFEVRFLVLSERGPLAGEVEAAGVPVHLLGLDRHLCAPIRPGCLPAVLRALRRYRALTRDVDIVDGWLVPAMTFSMVAQPLAHVPVLIGGRRNLGDVYQAKPLYRRAAAAAAERWMTAVVANSRAAALEVASQEGVLPSRVHVIPNAVLPSTSTAGDRQRYREAWGAAQNDIVVGCVANYKREKGLDLLIDAAGLLREEVPHLRIVVVGEGPLRRELEVEIHRRRLDGIVRLHGLEPDARPAFGAFDALVQASRSEGLPNAVLEGAAAGLPIVATDVGGTSEILTADRDALLVRKDDASALAHAIRRVVSEPELRRRLGAAARMRAADFSAERLIERTAALYRELAGRSPTGARESDGDR